MRRRCRLPKPCLRTRGAVVTPRAQRPVQCRNVTHREASPPLKPRRAVEGLGCHSSCSAPGRAIRHAVHLPPKRARARGSSPMRCGAFARFLGEDRAGRPNPTCVCPQGARAVCRLRCFGTGLCSRRLRKMWLYAIGRPELQGSRRLLQLHLATHEVPFIIRHLAMCSESQEKADPALVLRPCDDAAGMP